MEWGYNAGMTPIEQILEKGGERVLAAEKDRVRLTIYVDSDLHTQFRQEAENEIRSLSDQMNSILAERYKEQKTAARVNSRTNGRT